MIVRGRRWWCCVSWVRASSRGPWWSCVGFVGPGRHWGLLCATRVFVAVVVWSLYFVGLLLSFLDSWGRVTMWSSCGVAWGRHGGEADVGCRWRCVEVVGGVVGVVVVS